MRVVPLFVVLPLVVAGSVGRARADGSAGDPAAGRVIYEANCQLCHGPLGKGDGPGAAALNPKPANFSEPRIIQIPDSTRLKVVTDGGAAAGLSPVMPAFKDTLSAQEIRDVLAFIRQRFSR